MDLWALEYKFYYIGHADQIALYKARARPDGWISSNRGNLTLEEHLKYISNHVKKDPRYYSNETWHWRLRQLSTDETIPVEVLI